LQVKLTVSYVQLSGDLAPTSSRAVTLDNAGGYVLPLVTVTGSAPEGGQI